MTWLVATIIKATALLLVVGLVAGALRRASASLRHLVWSAGIGAVLVLPVLTLTVPWRLAVLPSALASTQLAEPSAGPSVRPSAGPSVRPSAGPSVRPSADRPPRLPARPPAGPFAVAALWAIVAAFLLGRLFVGSAVLTRVVRRATPLETRDWTRPLLEAADRLGLPRLPQLVRSDRLPMPYACGLLRPTIVLPTHAIDWTDRQRRAVLCHELAHLRRFDLLVNAIAQVACALWWFHPLVWIAARQLRLESERACDDLVLGVGTRASEYADHLLGIVCQAARARTPAIALPMAQRREFEGRMLAILERGARRAPASRRHAASLAVVGLVIVLPLAALGVRGAARPTSTPGPVDPTSAAVVPGTTGAPASASSRRTTQSADRATETELVATAGKTDSMGTPDRSVGRVASPAFGGPVAPVEEQEADTSRTVVFALVNALLHDSVANVRRDAAYALGELEAPFAVTPLGERVLRDPSPAVREMAGWALGQIGSRESTKPLSAAALDDRSAFVRAIAVWALGEIDDSTAVTALASIVAEDSSAEVRARAAWALGSIGVRPAPPTLMQALTDATPRVRLTAAWALGQIGDAAAAPALATALDDSVPDVRRVVFWALGEMDGSVARGVLIKALDDADPEVRAQAARALGGNGSDPWPWPWPMPRFGGHADAWSQLKADKP